MKACVRTLTLLRRSSTKTASKCLQIHLIHSVFLLTLWKDWVYFNNKLTLSGIVVKCSGGISVLSFGFKDGWCPVLGVLCLVITVSAPRIRSFLPMSLVNSFGSARKLRGEWRKKKNTNASCYECWISPPEICKYNIDFSGIELDLADSSFHWSWG